MDTEIARHGQPYQVTRGGLRLSDIRAATCRTCSCRTRLPSLCCLSAPSVTPPPPSPHSRLQVIGVLAIGGWVLGTMGPFFLVFKALGALRTSAEEEQRGLDVSKHGVSAGCVFLRTGVCVRVKRP
jgi:hypothetical protein